MIQFPNPVNPDRVLINNSNLESAVTELGAMMFDTWGPIDLELYVERRSLQRGQDEAVPSAGREG